MRQTLTLVLLALALSGDTGATKENSCEVPRCDCPCSDGSIIANPMFLAIGKDATVDCISQTKGVTCECQCAPTNNNARNLFKKPKPDNRPNQITHPNSSTRRKINPRNSVTKKGLQ
ncbi:hypothetical protein PSHT_09214 [Puccinia striiformis]|uniref:Uncharacterized protein n=1 Tax=Puccinia striiformis TaxID=27350 RepID=A0A2S4VIR6_9BASI|nr:hypothetical protein PSHT_09214 [Puccinia striiformis]